MSPAISNENRSYCYDMNSTSIIFDLNVILLKTFHMFLETMTAVLVTSKSDPRTTAFELMFVFFFFFLISTIQFYRKSNHLPTVAVPSAIKKSNLTGTKFGFR